MSPEQARGKAVDKRSDMWAFGCVLYELLTGKAAFQGEGVHDILASVVRAEPDLSLLPDATPQMVRTLLRRCLQKDKTSRLRDAGDARIEIQEALAAPLAAGTRAAPTPSRTFPRWAPMVRIRLPGCRCYRRARRLEAEADATKACHPHGDYAAAG